MAVFLTFVPYRSGLLLLLGLISLAGCQPGEANHYDDFGGYTAIRQEATGWFQVAQVGNRWMFITPAGHGYLALGANHTGHYLKDSAQSSALYERVGGDTLRAEVAMYEAYRAAGLNAGEAYEPHNAYLSQRLPYIAHLDYPDSKFAFDIFDDSVQTSFRKHLIPACRQYANDSLVLGIAFVDLPIWDARRVDFFRSLPPEAPGKIAYAQFLEEVYQHDIDRLNATYDTTFADFAALRATTDWKPDQAQTAVQKDDSQFMGRIAEVLYPLLRDIVREGAPRHLFMGERYVLRMVPEPVLQAVGRYVDVFCTQALILSPWV